MSWPFIWMPREDAGPAKIVPALANSENVPVPSEYNFNNKKMMKCILCLHLCFMLFPETFFVFFFFVRFATIAINILL